MPSPTPTPPLCQNPVTTSTSPANKPIPEPSFKYCSNDHPQSQAHPSPSVFPRLFPSSRPLSSLSLSSTRSTSSSSNNSSYPHTNHHSTPSEIIALAATKLGYYTQRRNQTHADLMVLEEEIEFTRQRLEDYEGKVEKWERILNGPSLEQTREGVEQQLEVPKRVMLAG